MVKKLKGIKLTGGISRELKPKELNELYDRLYDIADRLIKKHNPCNIHTERGVVLCNCHNLIKEARHEQKHGCFVCCNTCKYGGKHGCTVKNLSCKVFTCSQMDSKIARRLHRLCDIRRRYYLYGEYYITKEKYMKIVLNKRRQRLKNNKETVRT